MIKINVETDNKLWKKKIKDPKIYFKEKLKKISNKVNFFKKKNLTFTILLTNSAKMKKLNKKFRNINKPTDVLSFPSFSKKYLRSTKEKKIYLGDVSVSYEIINLRSKNSSFSKEFDQVWIHGLLHLMGYDHIKNRDYYIMNRVEKKFLSSII